MKRAVYGIGLAHFVPFPDEVEHHVVYALLVVRLDVLDGRYQIAFRRDEAYFDISAIGRSFVFDTCIVAVSSLEVDGYCRSVIMDFAVRAEEKFRQPMKLHKFLREPVIM